jgi:hypothetical protein
MLQVFLRILWLSPVRMFSPLLYAHFHLHVAVTSRTNGRRLGTLKKESSFANRVTLDIKVILLSLKRVKQTCK